MPRFLWGAATSSHQIDGNNRHNDWWAWEIKGKIEGGARSGLATDHRRLFKDDLARARDLGLNSYRFSFEWSRIEPEEGKWDSAAEDWYAELLTECEANGLLPMATLHHFTSPLWFSEQGGFTEEKCVRRFRAFVERVVQRFGPRIPLWCTLNEPMVLVAGSYLGRFMPPGEYAPKAASLACANLLRCHVSSYEAIHKGVRHREGPFKNDPVMVGFAHNMLDFQAERPFHPIELLVARQLDRLYNRSWLSAVTGGKHRFGLPGVFPKAPEVAEARGRRTADFIGVNYYTKALVHWRPRTAAVERGPEIPIGVSFARRKEPVSDLGWALHPQGLRNVLRMVAAFGLPIYITENGIADRDDRLRSRYILEHLEVLADVIRSGVDIRGYFHWSLLDNFEWIKGFGPRFGLYTVDYESLSRQPTRSAALYREIIGAHERVGVPDASILSRFQRHR